MRQDACWRIEGLIQFTDLEDSLENYQHLAKTGIGMFLETGEEFLKNVLFD